MTDLNLEAEKLLSLGGLKGSWADHMEEEEMHERDEQEEQEEQEDQNDEEAYQEEESPIESPVEEAPKKSQPRQAHPPQYPPQTQHQPHHHHQPHYRGGNDDFNRRQRPHPQTHHQPHHQSHHSHQSYNQSHHQAHPQQGQQERKRTEGKKFLDSDVPIEGPYVMYVANLNYQVNIDSLKRHFKNTKILDVSLPFDKEKQRSRGFGHIVFEDRESLVNGLQMQGSDFIGRPIRVDLTDKVKAQSIAQTVKRRSIPISEADAQSDWRSAPKKPTVSRNLRQDSHRRQRVRNETPTQSTDEVPDIKVETPSAPQPSTTKETTTTPTTEEPTTNTKVSTPVAPEKTKPKSSAPTNETQTTTAPTRSSNVEVTDQNENFEKPTARGVRQGRGPRGNSRGGSSSTRGRGGGRGGRRGPPNEILEIEKDFQKILSDSTPTTKKTKSNRNAAEIRNAFALLNDDDENPMV